MKILFLLAVALVVGCQSYYRDRIYGNENSPYFSMPVESRVVLKEELEIPTRSDRVFFQDGKIVPIRQVNRYLPYCHLEVDVWKERPQRVAPDTFVVRRVYDELRFQLAVHHVRLAQKGRGGMDYHVLARVHELASEKQPDVRFLVCADWGPIQDSERVTISTMRKQLGRYFDLQLALVTEEDKPAAPPAGRSGY